MKAESKGDGEKSKTHILNLEAPSDGYDDI